MIQLKRWLLVVGAILTLGSEAWAVNTDLLREYVLIVRPKHRPESKELLQGLANYFSEKRPELAKNFAIHGSDSSHGTGWVFRSPSGELYIVTNRHVIGAAGGVEVVKEVLDDSMEPIRTTITDASIVFVDDHADLAILRANLDPKQKALPVRSKRPSGGTTVWAAGFPGFGGLELWQATQGHITNPAAPKMGGRQRVLQHSATIDPGNSGGPLLIETDDGGFEVAGVNTWSAMYRTNVNFAISIDELTEVIAAAEAVAGERQNPGRLKEQLDERAKLLAGELSSGDTNAGSVESYVSYLYVTRWGFQSFLGLMSSDGLTDEDRATLQASLEEQDPLQQMRKAAAIVFTLLAKRNSRSPSVQFKGVNVNDESQIGQKPEIRTTFAIDSDDVEVTWTYEHGHWRISDDNFDDILAAASAGPGGTVVETPGANDGTADDAGDSASTDLRRKTSGAVFIPKFGLLLGGGFENEASVECSGAFAGQAGCGAQDSPETDLAGGISIGADFLFHPGKNFRIGPGLVYHPTITDEVDGQDFDNGSEIDVNFVAELVLDTSPSFALLLRGNLGLGIFLPDDDWLDSVEAGEAACNLQPGIQSCSYDTGPATGLTWGAGFGLLFPMTSFALRTELMYTSFTFSNEFEQVYLTPAGSFRSVVDTNLSRTMVVFGLDL